MKMPGFTAEVSVHRLGQCYCFVEQQMLKEEVIPQRMRMSVDGGARARGIFGGIISPVACYDVMYPCYSKPDGTVGYCCCETVCI